MGSVKKSYHVTMSKAFSDGTIIVCKFGTELEEEGADPDELFAKASAATQRDIMQQAKKDKIAKQVVSAVKNSIKKADQVSAAEKDFERA